MLILTDNRSLTQFFQAKSIPPSLWNFLDRVLCFNIVIVHIPGKANYAADFLSRMRTDPAATLSLKLTDNIPVREIQIESEAKTPDAALSSITEIETLFEIPKPDAEFLEQLKTFGLYESYQLKIQQQPPTENTITGLVQIRKKAELNAVEFPDPADNSLEVVDHQNPLDLKVGQQRDSDILRTI